MPAATRNSAVALSAQHRASLIVDDTCRAAFANHTLLAYCIMMPPPTAITQATPHVMSLGAFGSLRISLNIAQLIASTLLRDSSEGHVSPIY